jgi:transposase
MAPGQRRTERQQEVWVATAKLPALIGHVFYGALNGVLRDGNFDDFAESPCGPFHKECGRPGIPPGIYFRMIFVRYFEGIDSQRGIAWRCRDSLSLHKFLGYSLHENTTVCSSLIRIRQRLLLKVFEEVFAFVLSLIEEHGLLKGKTVGVDSTLLEANAAMDSPRAVDCQSIKHRHRPLRITDETFQTGLAGSFESIPARTGKRTSAGWPKPKVSRSTATMTCGSSIENAKARRFRIRTGKVSATPTPAS